MVRSCLPSIYAHTHTHTCASCYKNPTSYPIIPSQQDKGKVQEKKTSNRRKELSICNVFEVFLFFLMYFNASSVKLGLEGILMSVEGCDIIDNDKTGFKEGGFFC